MKRIPSSKATPRIAVAGSDWNRSRPRGGHSYLLRSERPMGITRGAGFDG